MFLRTETTGIEFSVPSSLCITLKNSIYTESRKMVQKNLFTMQQWRNRHGEQTHGHGERGGKGEMCAKSNMET